MFFQKKQISVLFLNFFLMIRNDFFSREATMPMCGLDKIFFSVGFYVE